MSQARYARVDASPGWVEARLRALSAALALPAPTRASFLFRPDAAFYQACTESVVSLQAATARLVAHLGLRCDAVVVTFVGNLPSAAHIQRDRGTWYVEIDSRWRGDGLSLGAILAHEICHILVEERGLARFDTAVDEVHVDLAVMLSGLGALTVNGNREEAEHIGPNTIRTRTFSFGYLSPGLLSHAYAVVVGTTRVNGAAPLRFLDARLELLWRAVWQVRAAPLCFGPAAQARAPCGGCGKTLGFPAGKRGKARCHACGHQQPVYAGVARVTVGERASLVAAPLPEPGLGLTLSLLAQRVPAWVVFVVIFLTFCLSAPYTFPLVASWVRAPVGAVCERDRDCASGECLLPAGRFSWENPTGPGTCTAVCVTNADCANGTRCGEAESYLVLDRFSPDARKIVQRCVPGGP